MTREEAINELAGLRYRNGYSFENGTPYREALGAQRASGLVEALSAAGHRLVKETEAPSVVAEQHSHDDVGAH